MWNAKNGAVKIGDSDMDYVSFGTGRTPLVLIPGVGDGLKTVKGMALPLAFTYREFAKQYTVYAFSRKNGLEEGYSTKDMARDQAEAMKTLGIAHACLLGVSQGGMICQHLAIQYPPLVEKLILAVTLARPNETVREVVGGWMEMARRGDYRGILLDTAEKSYSEKYKRKYRLFYSLLGRAGGPKDFSRFRIQAASCIRHDAYAELEQIQCPTLVIGGGRDEIVGARASEEIAERIKGSRLWMYPELGHGAYEEAKDFNRRVMEFFAAGN